MKRKEDDRPSSGDEDKNPNPSDDGHPLGNDDHSARDGDNHPLEKSDTIAYRVKRDSILNNSDFFFISLTALLLKACCSLAY